MDKEALNRVLSMLEGAEDFYVPVKKIWKELSFQGYDLPQYNEFLDYLKKDKRFEIRRFKEVESEDENEEEMEKAGFYSGPRAKLRKRKITKEDMKRITLEHTQRVVGNLIKAYEVKPEDFPEDSEDQLIELMKRAKQLKEKIEEAFKEIGRK